MQRLLAVVLLACVLVPCGTARGQGQFWRGDLNKDGAIDITDAINVLGYEFLGDPKTLPCLDAADVNDSGELDIADPIYLLNYLYTGGPAPVAPFPQIDIDPTDDALDCGGAPIEVTSDITTDTHWTNDHVYLLKAKVFIRSPAVLTIDPGTTVLGDEGTQGILAADRGAQIIAVGSPTRPIVFTSAKPYGQRKAHDWGGVMLIGRADNNYPGHEADAEGFPADVHIQFGPEDHIPKVNDSSGHLSYVRIEFGGTVISPNNEVNGLSLFSVGRGTQLDHINVRFNADDAVEWFGGNADLKYLYSMGCQDDQVDHSFGARFRCQFVVSQLVGNGCDRGFEVDDDEAPAGTYTELPRTRATVTNFSFIGDPFYTPNTTVEQGIDLRRGCAGVYLNGLVMGFPKGGLNIDDAVTTEHNPTNGYLVADYITFFQNGKSPDFNQPMGQHSEIPGDPLYAGDANVADAQREDAAHNYHYTSVDFAETLNPHNNTAAASPFVNDVYNHFQTDANNRPVFTYTPSAEVAAMAAFDQRTIGTLMKPNTFIHGEDANGSNPADPAGTATGIYSSDWADWFDYAPWRGAIVPPGFDINTVPAAKRGEDCYRDWTHDPWISTSQS